MNTVTNHDLIQIASKHSLWPRALECAKAISYEDGEELNAVEILKILHNYKLRDVEAEIRKIRQPAK